VSRLAKALAARGTCPGTARGTCRGTRKCSRHAKVLTAWVK
jgi:hypothetical protein